MRILIIDFVLEVVIISYTIHSSFILWELYIIALYYIIIVLKVLRIISKQCMSLAVFTFLNRWRAVAHTFLTVCLSEMHGPCVLCD